MNIDIRISTDLSSRQKRILRWTTLGVVIAVAAGASVANAAVDTSWIDAGQPVSAQKLTADLAGLDSRITSLEGADGGTSNIVPPGTIIAYGGATPPEGWLLCDGTSLLQSAYPALFNVIHTSFGSASTSSFNLPDLRGRFLRGVDGTAGVDPDRDSRSQMNNGGNTGNAVGSVQADMFRAHNHTMQNGTNDCTGFNWIAGYHTVMCDVYTTATTYSASTPPGGTETRPVNAYVNYMIKY